MTTFQSGYDDGYDDDSESGNETEGIEPAFSVLLKRDEAGWIEDFNKEELLGSSIEQVTERIVREYVTEKMRFIDEKLGAHNFHRTALLILDKHRQDSHMFDACRLEAIHHDRENGVTRYEDQLHTYRIETDSDTIRALAYSAIQDQQDCINEMATHVLTKTIQDYFESRRRIRTTLTSAEQTLSMRRTPR